MQGNLSNVPSSLEAIIALYVLIFVAWQLLPTRLMTSHFEVSQENARRRPWTFLTAPFSNSSLFDVIGNLQILLMVAPALQQELGDRLFWVLYLTGRRATVWGKSVCLTHRAHGFRAVDSCSCCCPCV